MKYRRKFIVALATATLAVLGVAAKRNAAPSLLPLRNYGSGLCLQPVPYLGQYYDLNALPIMQTYCTGEAQQQWSLVYIGQGYVPGRGNGFNLYHIVNGLSGQCLDDKDGNTADRAPVQQWTCNSNSTTMMWTQGTQRFGAVELVNVRSGKCLDVPAASITPGALMQIYHCSTTTTVANTAQLFQWF